MASWLRLGLQIQYILRIKRSRCVSSAARASLWLGVLLSFSEQHSPLIVGGRRDGSSLALTRADSCCSSFFLAQRASVLLCVRSPVERFCCPPPSAADGGTLLEPPLPFCPILDPPSPLHCSAPFPRPLSFVLY